MQETIKNILNNNGIIVLDTNGKIVSYQGNAYHAHIAYVEEQLAQNIKKQMNRFKSIGYENLDEELDVEETKLKMKFAPEQREPVLLKGCRNLIIERSSYGYSFRTIFGETKYNSLPVWVQYRDTYINI